MKTKLLIALWLCYALMPSISCANEGETKTLLRDTIIILPDSNVKVIFIGDELENMSTYKRIDSLVNMLIIDVKKAQAISGYPESPKTTHYFVTEEGKRRLKAESEDYLEQSVDIEKEKRSLTLGLLPYVYFIHDFASGYEIQIYLSNLSQLNSLSNYNLSSAVATIANDKRMQRHNFRVDLERRDSEWILLQMQRRRDDMIEITPAFGFGLLGNQFSPAVGIDLRLQFSDKYGLPKYRVGLSYLGYTFTQSNTLDFENLNFVQSYGIKFMSNLTTGESGSGKNKWIGFSGGFLTTSNESELNNRIKAGIVADGFGPFNFSFDVIFLKNKKAVYGMTMLLPF